MTVNQAVTDDAETPDRSEIAELFAKWNNVTPTPARVIDSLGWPEGLLFVAGWSLAWFALGFTLARAL